MIWQQAQAQAQAQKWERDWDKFCKLDRKQKKIVIVVKYRVNISRQIGSWGVMKTVVKMDVDREKCSVWCQPHFLWTFVL